MKKQNQPKINNNNKKSVPDKQAKFALALRSARNGSQPSLAGLTNKQRAAVSLISSSRSPQVSTPSTQLVRPEARQKQNILINQLRQPKMKLSEDHHALYASLWHAHGAPHGMHIPRPCFAGGNDEVKYVNFRAQTSTYTAVIAAGQTAYVFYDRSSHVVKVWAVAATNTDFSTAITWDANAFITDRHDTFSLPRAAIPQGVNNFQALLPDDVGSYDASGNFVCPLFTSGEFPSKQQVQYCETNMTVSIPYTGSAIVYTLAPEISPQMIGSDSRRVNLKDTVYNSSYQERASLASILSIPNMSLGTISFRDLVNLYAKVSLLRGASDTAVSTFKVRGQCEHGFVTPGQPNVTDAPINVTSRNSVGNSNYPKNCYFHLLQGGFVLTNTSATDNLTISVSGRAVGAITEPSANTSTMNTLLRSAFLSSACLRRNGAIDTRLGLTHSHSLGAGQQLPPTQNSTHPSSHDELEQDVTSGLAAYGGMKLIENPTFKNAVSSGGNFLKKAMSEAAGFAERVGVKAFAEAPKLLEGMGKIVPFMV